MTPPSVTLTSDAPARTNEVGAAIGACLRAGDLLRLFGELGAGKTCLVRGIARGMGIDAGVVHSPTYTIANEYRAPRALLHHVDAYRINSDDDLDAIGWDHITDGTGVLCIEWPERLGDAVIGSSLDVTLHHAGEEVRTIEIDGLTSFHSAERLLGLLHEQ